MMRKTCYMALIAGFIIGLGVFFLFSQPQKTDKPAVDAITSATPVALYRQVPPDCSFLVSGQVAGKWEMNAGDFRRLAHARIRAIETESSGDITGAYIYQGVPLLYILEGVVPVNRPADPFDRPLDMLVVVENGNRSSSWFSYGELTMCDDTDPVMLAFYREELLPSKDPEKYTRNAWKGPQRGLRLIAPRDLDNSRYIDMAEWMLLIRPDWPVPQKTPTMKIPGKGAPVPKKLVISEGAMVVWQGRPDQLNLPVTQIDHWRHIGHGRGLKSTRSELARGFRIADLLMKIFPRMTREDAVLVIAVDGYRSLFSGREILEHPQGQKLLIHEDTRRDQGWTVLSAGDFFVDRCVRTVSHIVRLPADEIARFVRENLKAGGC